MNEIALWLMLSVSTITPSYFNRTTRESTEAVTRYVITIQTYPIVGLWGTKLPLERIKEEKRPNPAIERVHIIGTPYPKTIGPGCGDMVCDDYGYCRTKLMNCPPSDWRNGE